MLTLTPTPQSAAKHRGRCASLGALGKTKPRQKTTAGQASTTYLHQPPCRPFTQSPNIKPELTPFQVLPFNTTDALYTPILASQPEDILFARAYTHLIRAPPIETDVHFPRDTYPAGYPPGRDQRPSRNPVPRALRSPSCTLPQLSPPLALGLPWRARPSS